MTEQTAHKEPLTAVERIDRRDDLFDRCIAIAFSHRGDALRDDTIPNAVFAIEVDLNEQKELVERGAS